MLCLRVCTYIHSKSLRSATAIESDVFLLPESLFLSMLAAATTAAADAMNVLLYYILVDAIAVVVEKRPSRHADLQHLLQTAGRISLQWHYRHAAPPPPPIRLHV